MRSSAWFCAAAIFVLPLAAAATPVTLKIDSVSGVWTAASGAPATTQGIGTNMLGWGVPVGTEQSSYVFQGIAPPAVIDILPGSVFELGEFTHNNFRIYPDAITNATLQVTVTGSTQNGTTQMFSMSVFEFAHLETPNQEPCSPAGAAACPDVVTPLLNMGASESVVIDGVEYVLNVTGFQGIGPSFITEEDQMNMAVLEGGFVARSTAVPVPAALPLLASALGFLAFLARRRA